MPVISNEDLSSLLIQSRHEGRCEWTSWTGGLMPKSLSTFLEECRREIPNEVIHISKPIDPAHYDATAIIKHLGAQKKFPIAIFDQPLNLHGKVSEFKLVLNCEISQRKTQIALGFPREMSRGEMAEACLSRVA
jgi:hypothetical protein